MVDENFFDADRVLRELIQVSFDELLKHKELHDELPAVLGFVAQYAEPRLKELSQDQLSYLNQACTRYKESPDRAFAKGEQDWFFKMLVEKTIITTVAKFLANARIEEAKEEAKKAEEEAQKKTVAGERVKIVEDYFPSASPSEKSLSTKSSAGILSGLSGENIASISSESPSGISSTELSEDETDTASSRDASQRKKSAKPRAQSADEQQEPKYNHRRTVSETK